MPSTGLFTFEIRNRSQSSERHGSHKHRCSIAMRRLLTQAQMLYRDVQASGRRRKALAGNSAATDALTSRKVARDGRLHPSQTEYYGANRPRGRPGTELDRSVEVRIRAPGLKKRKTLENLDKTTVQPDNDGLSFAESGLGSGVVRPPLPAVPRLESGER